MSLKPDVIVVGGGVIGLTTAYFLAQEGAKVQVFDQGELGAEASWAGAGIIPPCGRFSSALAPIDQLRSLSVSKLSELSVQLRSLTGIDIGYRFCGGIEFYGDEEPPLEAWKREAISFEKLSRAEIAKLEPVVANVPGDGYFFPGMAQIRNPWHLRALIAACRESGVELRPRTGVAAFDVQRGKVTEVRLDSGEKRSAGAYLIAAGAWSNPLLAPFKPDAGIHPVRGQIVLLRTPRPVLSRIILVGKNYLVPREDGRLLIGATEEPEAGFVKRNTVAGVGFLLDFAAGLAPSLRSAEVEKTWSGLRPGSLDGLPFLGAIPGYDNAYVATGHFRAGIQLSAGTAELMTQVILGRPSSFPLEFFRLDREPIKNSTPTFRS